MWRDVGHRNLLNIHMWFRDKRGKCRQGNQRRRGGENIRKKREKETEWGENSTSIAAEDVLQEDAEGK